MLCYTSQTVFVIDGTNIHEAFIGSLSYCNFIIKPLNFPIEDSPQTQHYWLIYLCGSQWPVG